MSNSEEKARIRALILANPAANVAVQGWGRAAEQVRRLEGYRAARQIYVGPAPSLLQVRINALLDGKELIMPAAGLREGFYRLLPFVIPFKELSMAVTFRGMVKHGRRLPTAELARLQLSLMVTDALAVDEEGGRLGKGTGFFDLACAIFAHYQALTPECATVGVIGEWQRQATLLPRDPWDVALSTLVSQEGGRVLAPAATIPEIYFDLLPPRRVRKLQPLWEIYAARQWGERAQA